MFHQKSRRTTWNKCWNFTSGLEPRPSDYKSASITRADNNIAFDILHDSASSDVLSEIEKIETQIR